MCLEPVSIVLPSVRSEAVLPACTFALCQLCTIATPHLVFSCRSETHHVAMGFRPTGRAYRCVGVPCDCGEIYNFLKLIRTYRMLLAERERCRLCVVSGDSGSTLAAVFVFVGITHLPMPWVNHKCVHLRMPTRAAWHCNLTMHPMWPIQWLDCDNSRAAAGAAADAGAAAGAAGRLTEDCLNIASPSWSSWMRMPQHSPLPTWSLPHLANFPCFLLSICKCMNGRSVVLRTVAHGYGCISGYLWANNIHPAINIQ